MTHQLTKTKSKRNAAAKPPAAVKRPTKKSQLIKLLARKAGADAGMISVKFGWQPHTTRAALSGLRKAGFELSRENAVDDKPLRHRIVAASPTETVADVANGQ